MQARGAFVVAGTITLGAVWLAGCSGGAASNEATVPNDAASARATGPNEVTVIGLDYAFGGVGTLPPGPTAIAFENRGEVDHEMILVRLKEGVTLEQLMEAARSEGDPRELTEGGPGILIASPGQTTASRLLVDLEAGRTYALVCNFQDEPDAPPHTALGMLAAFQVSEG